MHIQVNLQSIAAGDISASQALEAALHVAASPACESVFVRRFDEQARATAMAVDQARATGMPLQRLAGLPVSIKDLFDVAGQPTTAGSRSRLDVPPARFDCPAVARLRASGAVLLGHTNLSEFAFSGVGINPHFGTPVNPCSTSEALIPGGSTSGGAVSVATGAAFAALGSDTGGSIRIPAALQGLVGFKSTQRLVPLEGSIPLSTTLDTACAITRTVVDALVLHEVLADRSVNRSGRPLSAMRFVVPRTVMLDALQAEVAAAFERSLAALARSGASITEVDLPELAELSGLQAQGGFAAAESWAWHRRRLEHRSSDYDPRVAMRIRRGAAISAADYLDLHQTRRDWITRTTRALHGFDAALSPTVPMLAPALAPLVASDDAFFATNAALLRNTSVINLLDGCATSLPALATAKLPVGLMVWGSAMADDAILEASLAIESALRAIDR